MLRMRELIFVPIVLLFTLLFLISGCDPKICCAIYDTSIDFSFIDQDGNDLLDPAHPNAITEQNTDLYYLIDGELVKQHEGHLDHPKKFFVSDEKSPFNENYFLRVFSNILEGQDTAITYLEFEDNSIDTIKTQYEILSNSSTVTKVWYNGALRWDTYGKNKNEYISRYMTVTKNIE